MQLVIGNKNYSSWSLRPWLAIKMCGLGFDEISVTLGRPESKSAILKHSPSGRVPCLIDGNLKIWDSLAICEYVNEKYAGGRLWPEDLSVRASARSVTAEMHSGFSNVRSSMPMDIRSRWPEKGAAARAHAEVANEIERIRSLLSECLAASNGPFLFGEFSIADAFYAPVLTRFQTYGVDLSAPLQAYRDRVFALPPMQQWMADAHAETHVIPY